MKGIISAIEAAAAHATTWPTGRKLDPPSSAMSVEGRCLGPASALPDSSTLVGIVEGARIEAPADAPGHEAPNIWTDVPSWMLCERW